MVEPGRKGNTLAGLQHQPGTGRQNAHAAVGADRHRRVGKPFVFVAVIQLDHEIPATAVDDVLRLAEMKVHRAVLILFGNEDLFRVGFGAVRVAEFAVADGEQEKADFAEVASAVVGNVPAQHTLANFVEFVSLLLPRLRRKVGKGWEVEAHLLDEAFVFPDKCVDLRSFQRIFLTFVALVSLS